MSGQEWDLPATTAAVRKVTIEVRELLAGRGLAAEALDAIELVLAEALNNVVEHALPGAEAGRISLRLCLGAGAVEMELRDSGRAMPGLVLPEGRLKPLGRDGDLPEGGFGWYLIRSLARDVRYVRRGGENQLRVSMPMQAPGAK